MKNLNNIGFQFQELNTKELQEVEAGGIVKDVWEVLKEVDAGWENFKDRLSNGYNSYGNCSCH